MKRITLFLFLIVSLAFGQTDVDPNYAIQRYTDLISKTQNKSALPTFYMQRGLARFQIGDFEEAKNDLIKSLDIGLEPQYEMQAQYYIGRCFDKLLRYEKAGSQYTLVLSSMNQDELISGGITWDQVLMDRVQVRKKQNLHFAALNDLKLYRSFNRQDTKVQIQIDSINELSPIFSALSRNAFRLFKSENQKAEKIHEAFQDGEYNKARVLASSEIGKDPIFLAFRGYVTMASGDYEQAEVDFEKSTELIRNFNFKGLSYFYLSFCKKQVGDLEGAINSISSALKVFTSEKSLIPTSEILLTKAKWEEEAGRMASAYDAYESYLKIRNDSKISEKILALADFKDKVDKPLSIAADHNNADSISSLAQTQEAAINKNKVDPENLNSDSGNEAVKTNFNSKSELSDFEKAIQRYTQLIQNNDNNSNLYMQRAIAYYHSEEFEQAISDLNTSLKNLAPQYLNQAYCYRALSYKNINNLNLAIADITIILQNTPVSNTPIIANVTTKDLLQIRSDLYLKTSKVIPAFFDLQVFRKADLNNENVNSVYDSLLRENQIIQFVKYNIYNFLTGDIPKGALKAKDFFDKGDFTTSDYVLRTELAKTTSNSELFLIAAYTSIIMQDFRQARYYLETFLTESISFENRALANFYNAFCWKQEGNIDEAINSITNSLKVFSTDRSLIPATDILILRASFFEKQGFTEMAYNDYVAYLKMKPGDSAVREKMQSLKPEVTSNTSTESSNPVQPKTEIKEEVNPLIESFKNEKRYALVIGNANYPKEIGALVNPVNDANDIAEELKKSNFEVTILLNATYRQIEVASVNFYRTLLEGPRDQTVGLFYYSGHGLQYEGENLIVPIDALAVSPTDIPYVCNKVDKILGKMEAANTRLNIMILDACRSNPFPVADRSINPGLAQVRPAKGSYVAFATAPGSTASDGVGRNGLYTQELLKSMKLPNLTIEQVFKNVRKNVLELSRGKQNTWDNSNIVGEFFFKIKN